MTFHQGTIMMIAILMKLYLFLLICIHKVLQENYYNIDSYLVQTRSQARSSGIKLPEVHGMRKNLDPNIKSEKQHANPIKGSVKSPAKVRVELD